MRPSDDPEVVHIQSRIKQLAERAIDEAFDIMDYGTPTQKAQLIARFGSHMLRALGNEADDGLEGLRRDFEQLAKEARVVRKPNKTAYDQDEGGGTRATGA